MKIDIETLKKTKGIGPKTIERIIEQYEEDQGIKAFKSEYIPSEVYTLDEDINLWQGDCIELMSHIPDKSIDMILCDLPYGIIDSKWDEIIPFEPLWDHYKRVITDNGAIVLFSSGGFTYKLANSQPQLYRYKWIWKKNRKGNFVNANNRPLTSYEEILVFSKGITANTKNKDLKMRYNPQGIVEINKQVKAGVNKFGQIQGNRPSHKDKYIQRYTNYPSDILEFTHDADKFHPTQKPVKLLEYLIKTYTDEGMIVLDNTMGSGSTGVACKNTGRRFIGIELNDEYFKIASERVNG